MPLDKFTPRAFICGTYRDLVEPRKVAAAECIRRYVLPIGMEVFPAADQERMEFICGVIESCDFVILILGGRCGEKILEGPYSGISFTEAEFDFASSKKIPILRFIQNLSEGEILDSNGGDKAATKAMLKFRTKANTTKLARPFNEIGGLISDVGYSIELQQKSILEKYNDYKESLALGTELEALTQKLRKLTSSTQDVEVISTSTNFDHSDYILNAKSLKIIMNDGFRFFQRHESALRKRAALLSKNENAISTNFCILSTDGPHLEIIAKRSGKTIANQKIEINKTKNFLNEIFSSCNHSWSIFQMKNFLPYCAFEYDDTFIATIYPNYKRIEEMPLLIFKRTSNPGDVYFTLHRNTDELFRLAHSGKEGDEEEWFEWH